jgi:hypothetical protein
MAFREREWEHEPWNGNVCPVQAGAWLLPLYGTINAAGHGETIGARLSTSNGTQKENISQSK